MNQQPSWQTLTGIQPSGEILPGPVFPVTDRMTVRRLRPMVYRVHNVTRGYVCFVTLRRMGRIKQARCDHDRCMEFCQPAGRLCKHLRFVVRHHVQRMRREQEMKPCSMCGEMKPLKDYYRMKQTPDGYRPNCKVCQNEAQRRAFANRDVEQYNARHRADHRKHRERHPEKVRARARLNDAKRAGKIEQGTCQVCGSTETEAHHANYDEPLNVVWLCKAHHTTTHAAQAA